MAHGMTEEELALLTPAERAGLEDDDLEEGEEGEEEDGAGDDQGDDDNGEGDDAGDDDGAAGSDDGNSDDDQPGRDDGDADDAADEEKPGAQHVPLIKAELPADFDDQMKALDDRKAAIRTEKRSLTDKYEDGDLTSKEYHDQLDKLDDELSEVGERRSELKWQENKAKLAQETNKSQVEARWYATVDVFMADHPEVTKNQTRIQAYDNIIQQVTAETIKAGKEPGAADLKKAYKIWAEDLGIATDGKADTTQAKQKPAKEKRNVPPTLGKVPAAETNDTDDGKYAYLDRLADKDPIKYEAEIAKLSASQWEEYSQS